MFHAFMNSFADASLSVSGKAGVTSKICVIELAFDKRERARASSTSAFIALAALSGEAMSVTFRLARERR